MVCCFSKVKKVGSNAPNESIVFSGNAVSSGLSTNSGVTATNISSQNNTPGNNVIIKNGAGYDRYNFRISVNKRTYNQTPLLNTRGEINPVADYTHAANVLRPALGDLSQFGAQIMNVNVTRLNPKTHIESSISVVGSQINI